jgi:hypothetical protein
MFISDPVSFHPGSRDQKGTGSRIRNTELRKILSIFNPKIVTKLSEIPDQGVQKHWISDLEHWARP